MSFSYYIFLMQCSVIWMVRGQQTDKPNIIFLLADDMGFNDVSFHGSPQIPTPNIDALAASGIILHRYYAAPQCTPSRASLMTGKYPINTGLQHYVINSAEPTALPIDFQTMPEHFKKLGYATHMVGKWHLGFYQKKYTPTYRGFDSFYGYWNGVIDYFDFTNYEGSNIPGINAIWGIDLHNNTEIIRDMRGNFSMEVFTKRAVEVIEEHDTSKPLFFYFSSHACHTGNKYQPMQAPPERVARFKHIQDKNRRTYAGIVSSLDDAVGDIFSTLDKKGMLENSIVIFVGDNGGEASGEHGGQASNWPLRAQKFYLFEGGVRVPAAVWSPLLNVSEPRTYAQKMHVSDWLPTLYSAAGGDLADLGNIDGIDMWNILASNSQSPRDEIMLNIDPFFDMAALIKGKYKLLYGTYTEGKDNWYGPSGRDDGTPASMDEWVWKNGSVVKSIMEKNGRWLLKEPDLWRMNTTVDCGKKHEGDNCGSKIGCCHHGRKGHGHFNKKDQCIPTKSPCLFDIDNDPCEYHNLARKYPKLVKSMLLRIKEFNETGYNSIATTIDPHGDPRCFGFAYQPWLDEEYASDCPSLD